MARRTSLTSTYDQLPLLLRIILQAIGGVVVGGIYRLVRFYETRRIPTLVVGILCTFTVVGNFIAWIVDLISLFVFGTYVVFVD